MHRTETSNGHEDNSVLIVNDEPDQLTLMGNLLHKAGYSVLTAEDGIEGLTLARRERPDLVISDVSMPRMNGLEFCREIRADSELKTVPILLVTALQKDTESAVAGLQAGADDYLEFPFDSARLVAKVSRLLERSRLEASYRDLVEQASDMIFTQDLAGKLTSINLAGQKFLGRKPEEIIGNSFFAVFGIIPESNGFAGSLGRPQEAREFRHQFVARSAAGEDRWLDLIVSPIKDKLDETIGFRGLARDITERKRFEEALRDSEERYRLLFESTPQPIWVYNEDTLAFLAVNEAATRIYGYSRDEFLSMTIDDIRPQEDIPTLMIKEAADANELVISSPWRHRTRAGKTIYVEMSSHPVVFDGKNSKLVIVNDVTERKLLDEKQQRLHTSLQQSAMEWRQTFNAIDFPVLIVDLGGTIKRSNLAAEQIVGIEAEQILGKLIGQLGENQPWQKAAELIEGIRDNSGTDFGISQRRNDRKNVGHHALSHQRIWFVWRARHPDRAGHHEARGARSLTAPERDDVAAWIARGRRRARSQKSALRHLFNTRRLRNEIQRSNGVPALYKRTARRDRTSHHPDGRTARVRQAFSRRALPGVDGRDGRAVSRARACRRLKWPRLISSATSKTRYQRSGSTVAAFQKYL